MSWWLLHLAPTCHEPDFSLFQTGEAESDPWLIGMDREAAGARFEALQVHANLV